MLLIQYHSPYVTLGEMSRNRLLHSKVCVTADRRQGGLPTSIFPK